VTRTDYLLDGRVKITQNAEGYRAGLDAVMLAAACPAQAGEINGLAEAGDRVLDLGCGAGASGLCLAARVENLHITGIEIQSEQADLARGNFLQNNLTAEIICADLKTHPFQNDIFDHVILNPPYHDDTQHDAPQNAQRAASFMMDDLTAWINTARRVVKTHGSVTIIHRADALAGIIKNLDGFGAIEIIPLWPRENVPAERVIIRARKGRKTPLTLRPGILLHTTDGCETEIARSILRNGMKIP